MNKRKSYGLFTSIAMIVGTVIGSGIFFKADDILNYTNGNMYLGMFLIGISGLLIILSSLSISRISQICDEGGIITYFEKFVSTKIAAGFGFFQTFVYFPTITVVVAWVCAIYIFSFLNLKVSFEIQIILSLVLNIILVTINTYYKKIGGYFQNISTAIKLLPLLAIALIGIFFKNETTAIVTTNSNAQNGLVWISALIPIMYSFDGWITATGIVKDVENSKKNITRALISAPFIILVVYIAYFYGINKILGSQNIMQQGDNSIFEAVKIVMNSTIGNFFLIFLIISMLGALNGLIMAGIRMPQSLAEKNFLKKPALAKIDPKVQMSKYSSKYYMYLLLFWTLIHYIITKLDLLKGRDISEISIVFSYILYSILYFTVIKLANKNIIKNNILNKLIPALSILVVLFLVFASINTSPYYVSGFMIFSALITYLGYRNIK